MIYLTAINKGISLDYIPMTKLKTSTVGIFIHRRLKKEEASLNAILPKILKRGCQLAKTRVEIEEYLDNLYGADLRGGSFKKGEDHVIYFSVEAITDKYTLDKEPLFKKMTELLMSIVFNPVTEEDGFKKAYVEQEKKNLIERIESLKNDKRSYASMRCVQEMCKGTDFATPSYGSVEDVKNIDSVSLYKYYKDLLQSSKIEIYVSGECDMEIAEKVIKDNLPDIEFCGGEIELDGILKKDSEVNYIEEKLDVTQGKLSMGFTTGIEPVGDEYFALMVANSIFGGGAHSKLFNNVREKLSLCYYASSSIDRYKSIMIVNAGIEFENYQKAYDEILNQLECVKKGEISELEYVSSINAIINSLTSCFDDQFAMQSFKLSEGILKTGNSLEKCIEKIKAVKLEDAVAAAQNIRLDTVYFLKGASV